MTTAYPGSIDSFNNPSGTDKLGASLTPHVDQHKNINDGMAAVQNTLGTDPQGGYLTVKARLVAGEAATTAAQADASAAQVTADAAAIAFGGSQYVPVFDTDEKTLINSHMFIDGTDMGLNSGKNLVLNSGGGGYVAADAIRLGYETTVTAAGTTTLVLDSKQQQFFTGSTTQTVTLPVASGLVLGQYFRVVNNSSGVVTVQSSGANSIQAMAADTEATFTCILTSGTTAASWDVNYSASGGITALTGDVTASGSGSVAATIANDAVTYAKIQNVSAASRLLGRGSASGSGDVEELTIGAGLSLSGTVLSSSAAGTITGSGTATVLPIFTGASAIGDSNLSVVTGTYFIGTTGDPMASMYFSSPENADMYFNRTDAITANTDGKGFFFSAGAKTGTGKNGDITFQTGGAVRATVMGDGPIRFSNVSGTPANSLGTNATMYYSDTAAELYLSKSTGSYSAILTADYFTGLSTNYLPKWNGTSLVDSFFLNDNDKATITAPAIITGAGLVYPILSLSQTWNSVGTTFTGLLVDVTNTTSASGSLLADLKVGGTSQFNVRKDGEVFGTGVSYSSAAGLSLAKRDANGNILGNNQAWGYTTQATAAGTTTIGSGASHYQVFTGSTTQTITLPVVSSGGMLIGQSFTVVNQSSGALAVNSSGGNLVKTVSAGDSCEFFVILLTGTTAASWAAVYYAATSGSGGITGSGTTGTLPVFTGSSAIGNSPITVVSGDVTIAAPITTLTGDTRHADLTEHWYGLIGADPLGFISADEASATFTIDTKDIINGILRIGEVASSVEFNGVKNTFQNKLNTCASTTSYAGIKLPHGTAPTSPIDGDLWSTTSGFFGRVNGATVGPFGSGGGSGTVTSVSVTTANGVSGSVATSTTTPAITLTLGAITPTSVNGLTVTTTTGTLTIASGKTLTASNSLTFTGTDGNSFAFPSGSDTVVTLTASQTLTNKTLTSPTLTAPVLGTPSSGTLTSCTGLPISTGVSGLASGIATFLATPSSANLLAALTTSTGTGSAMFGTTPTMSTPVINGIPTGTGVSVSTAGDTLVLRDATGIVKGISFFASGSAITSAAGTSTMLVNSAYNQIVIGSTTQTIKLPVASTLYAGWSMCVSNSSSGLVTVVSSGTNTIRTVSTGEAAIFVCVEASGTTAASWASVSASGSAITSITGDVTASGPGAAAATVNAINGVSMAGLATGILKNTTGTGAPSIAVAGDFPTLNQNTTGSAATLTTPRAINGVNFDGSAAITVTAAAGTLTGATLASGVTASSLTSFGMSPTLVTPILGTPTSGTLTSCTGLPISTGVSGLGSNVATFLATPSSANLRAALTDESGTGLAVFNDTPTLLTPVFTGLPTGTGVASAATASTLSARDANGNLLAAQFLAGYATTATAAGTTTLTVSSAFYQFFTGSTTQTVTLPVASTLALGQSFYIQNNSTGVVTVQSSGANSIIAMAANTGGLFTCILTSGTSAASWSGSYTAFNSITGTGNNVLATSPTLTTPTIGVATATSINKVAITAPATGSTLTIPDGVTMTGPASSGTVATLGNAETIAGVKTFNDGSVKLSGATSGASTLKAPAIASTYVHTLPAATDTLVGKATTDTLTNKRFTNRVTAITSSATPTINTDNCDAVDITALATAITSMTTNLTGTPSNKDTLIFEIKDDGTARAITWGASFVAGGVALPTTTVISKILTVGFMYSTANSLNKWRCIASAQEA